MKRLIPIILLFLIIGKNTSFAQGSWTAFVTNIAGSHVQAASFLNEKIGFVEAGFNWYRTNDGGVTWVLTHGLGIQSFLHLNFYYVTAQNIIVNGAFESNDSGLSWQKWGNPSLSESIYIKDSVLFDADGRMSFDHATNWQQINGYSGGEAIVGNLDKGVAMWGGMGFGIPQGSSLFTTDGGYTWHIGNAGIESDYGYAFPYTFTYLRSGGDGNDEIQRTTDGGATWKTAFKPIQPPSTWYLTDGIKGDGCVVFVQTDTTHVTPAGVIRSTDQGVTWVGIGGPSCTDDAPVCGACSRGAVCFAMDYYNNGNNTLWKYVDPAMLRSVLNDLTIDKLFPDTLFMNACDTSKIKVRLHFSACDYIHFHDLKIDNFGTQEYQSFFPIDTIIRTGFPDSGTIKLMPTVPGTYHLLVHITVAASDWSLSDTTLPFVLVVAGHPPSLIITKNDTVNFGAKQICISGGEDSLLLSNPSCEPLTVTQVRLESDTSGMNAYSVSMPLPFTIVRGSADGKIAILYHPRSAGVKSGNIIIVTDIGNDTIPLYALALPDSAKLTVTKNTPIDFPTQALCIAGGKDTIYLSDSSCISLHVTSIKFETDSTPASEFILSTQAPFDLQYGKPLGKCIITFHPTTAGIKTGRIIISTSIGNDTIPVSANILADQRTIALKTDTISAPICDSADGIVTIYNLSCRQMGIDSVASLSPFSILPKQLPIFINSGDSAKLKIRFTPSSRGIQNISVVASLKWYLPSGTISSDTTFGLTGFGLPGKFSYSLSNQTIDFDTVSLCDSATLPFILYSNGCDSLPLQNIVLSGDSEFVISASVNQPKEIAAGDSMKLNISLHPLSAGNKSAIITITFGDSTTVTVPVSAVIARVKRILSIIPNGVIDFGSELTCSNSDTLITLKNPSCDTILITGAGIQGSGFRTNTQFPITLHPGESKQIDIITQLDTSGGVSFNSSILNITSDADNILPPVTITREYIFPTPVHLWLDADPTPLTSANIWKAKLKGKPSELANIGTIDLSLIYNTDLLGYQPNLSSVKSADGKTFHISGSPLIIAGADSTIADLAFEVYLTKDTVTSLVMNSIILNSADPNFMGCIAIPEAAGIDFQYQNNCGDPSIRTFMQDGNAIRITSIRPNPVRDEVELELQSSVKENAEIAIYDALGIKMYSEIRNISVGSNQIHIDTKGLSGGMYFVRTGRASQSFVKLK